MDQVPLLAEMLGIFALSIAVILLCYRLHLPSVVGFLCTGILCGPYGLGLVHRVEDVQTFADVGIILLLFIVGMEVSVKQILELKRFFLVGGLLQVLFTIFVCWFIGGALGYSTGQSIFWGAIVALSSTAIVLRMLGQKGELDTPHGRGILAVLIFQDFCAVPMMLMTPFLGGASFDLDWAILWSALKGIVLITVTFSAAWLLVPKLLFYVARTRIRELFLFAVVAICLAIAWASAQAGLSLALGAFLAGLVISQSDFSYEAIGNILPFQDLFTSFFFVSVGMLLDIHFTLQHPASVLFLALAVFIVKSFAASLASLGVGMSLRSSCLMGFGLAQISEFSFVLAKEGTEYALMTSEQYQLFLAVSLLTMAMTPWIIANADLMASWIDALPIPERYKRGFKPPTASVESGLKEHVIIIGFGVTGRILALSCKKNSIPYAILEMNAETVRRERAKGEPIYFGDASHESVLEHVQIETAKVVAIVINDATAVLHIIKQVKKLNPRIYLVVRTRYLKDANSLHQLGADEVVADEYGAAIEVFSFVLNECAIAKEEIERSKEGMRELAAVFVTNV